MSWGLEMEFVGAVIVKEAQDPHPNDRRQVSRGDTSEWTDCVHLTDCDWEERVVKLLRMAKLPLGLQDAEARFKRRLNGELEYCDILLGSMDAISALMTTS